MKFKKILPAILCVFLALAFTGCTKDNDDDQEYLVEYGVIPNRCYQNLAIYTGFYTYTYEEIQAIKTSCKFNTIKDTYKKEVMDEHELRFEAAEIQSLTEAQIDMLLELDFTILFFERKDSTDKLWLYVQKL